MLRYKSKTRPGLVALYDIRPGNGAGPFLQPRSPHGATVTETQTQREIQREREMYIPDHPHSLQTVQWNKLPHCHGREYQQHEDDEHRTHSPKHTHTLCRHCIVPAAAK